MTTPEKVLIHWLREIRAGKSVKDTIEPSRTPGNKTIEEGKGKQKWFAEDPKVTVSEEQPLFKKGGKKVVEIPQSPPSTQPIPMSLAPSIVQGLWSLHL